MPTRLPDAPEGPYLAGRRRRGASWRGRTSVERIGATVSHPLLGALLVVPIAPERARPLRRQVLRPHQAVEEMAGIDTGHSDELVVGVLTGEGDVVGTGAVAPGAPPGDLAALTGPGPAWRVRAMATRPDARGVGVGTAVLEALFSHVRARGGGVVWCNARVPARRLYERAGLTVFGDVWVDPDIGPHVVMWGRTGAVGGR